MPRMTAPISLDLARARACHAAVAARAARAEGDALDALVAALPDITSAADVEAVVEHARGAGAAAP